MKNLNGHSLFRQISSKMIFGTLMAGLFALGSYSQRAVAADNPPRIEAGDVNELIANWSAKPKMAVLKMLDKYGSPLLATSEVVVWKDVGSFKRIKVTREETLHNFPVTHTDFLEHTVSHQVPLSRIADLVKFDSSLVVNRSAGELSVRCDDENHNIMALNLAHEMIEGKKDVKEARAAMGEMIRAELTGRSELSDLSLNFQPVADEAAFADRTTLGGAIIRSHEQLVDTDAEILGLLLAVDHLEVKLANEAIKKNLTPKVLEFAQMMRNVHGRLQTATTRLGLNVQIRPVRTEEVEKLLSKGSETMLVLLPLKDREFEVAYVDAMIKGHQEVLALVDQTLIKEVKNGDVKLHLLKFRRYVDTHLKAAQELAQALENQ